MTGQMMLKFIIINLSVQILSVSYAATTPCHDLQQSQLISLNERMNQMINTISALLPTPVKKPAPAVAPTLTPSADIAPKPPSYESTYYTSPPAAYTSPAPTSYIMYVSPPVTPQYRQPNSISTAPRQYSPIEPEFHPEYAFTPAPSAAPRRVRSQYPYEHYPLMQYQNSMPVTRPTRSSYPSVPYSFMQTPYTTNCNTQYNPEYSYAASRPNTSMYPSGLPPRPLPVYMPSNTLTSTYPKQPELRPSLYT